MSGLTATLGRPGRVWGFVHGEAHDALEDAILGKIDTERARETMTFTVEATCFCCGKKTECVAARDARTGGQDMACLPCNRNLRGPLLRSKPAAKPVQRRGGPYNVLLPTAQRPQVVHAPTKDAAKHVVARQLGRQRVPKGTRIWPVGAPAATH